MGNPAISVGPAAPEPVAARQLGDIFRQHDVFSQLSGEALDALARMAERVFVPAGTQILRKGSVADAALVVEHGRVRCDWGLDRTMLGDLGRGDVFGLGSVLGQRPMSGDVFALRDTRLVRLPEASLRRAVAEHADLLTAYARWQHQVALRSHGMGKARSLPNAFAVLPIGADPSVVGAAVSLCDAFGRVAGSSVVVDGVRAREVLGQAPAASKDFEQAPAQLLDWCEKQESEGRFLFFVCDAADTGWTRWCLRQTDKIVVVARADADADGAVERLDRRFADQTLAGSPVQVSLVLVHDSETDVPAATRRWLELRCLRRHHHVRRGNERDFERAARRLGERAVGVVLGGGGARGFAHIGVLQALEEAGVVVDHVGGTSMGSVMAAAYARGWSPRQILEIVANVFKSSRAVIDLDFPMVSMLAGAKLDRVLRSLFEDTDISDLWLPFYAISSSLTEARMVVHDRGPVWQAVRASASLPGVFPPVRANGHLLVDGGVVNNVPMDVMGERCGEGTVIAVDVGGEASMEFGPITSGLTGWALLRNRMNPFTERPRVPSIGQILVGSTMLSSKQYLNRLLEAGRVDLYLRPPVQDFELLGFDVYQRLYEIGYETARKELAGWQGPAAPGDRPGDASCHLQ